MHKPSNGVFRVLVCRARSRLCGLPLDAVEETLRPQPLRPLMSPAVHVQGLARIRGDWLPVVDLAGLLGLSDAGAAGAPPPPGAAPVRRYVVVRAGERRVALAVAEVLGLQTFAAEQLRALPPLLRDRDHGAVTALAERDDELIAVLDQARLLPDDLPPTAALSPADSGDAIGHQEAAS
ncbi:purine-binding chemotaxis protein CheW [Mitsuaria sp. BK045]|uniref:chemotaxis protein CheW n=1 Tax=unclassified Roseateles TaxID=2626991 RepID=UPI0016085BCC|nr:MULTISPECIES: chemotaxis protein CheW [unclassified Roseateles]MBB3294772.1 purine-binding chemotaxis protein CheW [Mitsuaria sp. BK041]MBB3363988.1 purine-binding chemotaxis protein CheW [Mitsuaria sp. BK045]